MVHRATTPTSFPATLRARIKASLKSDLPFSSDLVMIMPLPGDASNRRYYRLRLEPGTVSSVILMQLADPEAFKASEEAVSGSAADITELPFINVLTHLQRADIPVPTLYYYDQPGGLLYLEDFGDATLLHACQCASRPTVERLYAQAVDVLVRIQLQATTDDHSPCLALTRRFDVGLLMWEFDHFLEFGIEARRGLPLDPTLTVKIREEFHRIAEMMAAQPAVFTHRDYHSRNLMVHGGRLGVIDFQDALLGPPAYDLASLLRDAYIHLDDGLVEQMIDRYREGLGAGLDRDRRAAMGLGDRQAFRRIFDFTSIQRNLKAVGRFVYIDRVKRNSTFLADVPRTLGYVRQNLEAYPELSSLRLLLKPYVPEWQ